MSPRLYRMAELLFVAYEEAANDLARGDAAGEDVDDLRVEERRLRAAYLALAPETITGRSAAVDRLDLAMDDAFQRWMYT
jgi:hypothetical protein